MDQKEPQENCRDRLRRTSCSPWIRGFAHPPRFRHPRLVDFEQRIAGATYEQIAEAGGGIRSSLEGVRKAGRKLLTDKVLSALHEMAEQGTTTVEAKSGYGLTLDSEIKSLEAIHGAAAKWPGTVVAHLLGAHVVPREFHGRAHEYVDVVCKEMVPLVAERKLAQFVDVFTDRGAFTAEDTERIFDAAKKHGLGVRAHVCQLSETALRPLLRFNVASFDHMDHVSENDIRLLAKTETVATLVPGANYFLGLDNFPPARKLIDGGVAVALATDYNPGSSPTLSMPFVLSLACTHLKMSPAEAIAAATVNGAWALRLQERKGSDRTGKGRRSGGIRRSRLSRSRLLGSVQALRIYSSQRRHASREVTLAQCERQRRFERTWLHCYNRVCSKRFQRLDCPELTGKIRPSSSHARRRTRRRQTSCEPKVAR